MEIQVNLKNVKDLRDENYVSDILDEFLEYNNGYICDVIMEIADNNVSIYNSDLWEWASEHEEYVEEAVMEFGVDSKNFDLIKLFQQGQYLFNSQFMYEHMDEMILSYAYNYLCEEMNIDEITDEEQSELEDLLKGLDNNNKIEDIIEKTEELFGGRK